MLLQHLADSRALGLPQETLYVQSSTWSVTAQPQSQHCSQRTGCIFGVISHLYFTSLLCSAMALGIQARLIWLRTHQEDLIYIRLRGIPVPSSFLLGSSSSLSDALFRAVQTYPAHTAGEEQSLPPTALLVAEKGCFYRRLAIHSRLATSGDNSDVNS